MIVKVQRVDGPYVVIDKRIVNDQRLSLKAMGLLVYLLSKPPDWEVHICQLADAHLDGIAAVRSALDELQKLGYAKFERARKEDGTFDDGGWSVYDWETRKQLGLEPKPNQVWMDNDSGKDLQAGAPVGPDMNCVLGEPPGTMGPTVVEVSPPVVEPHVENPHVDNHMLLSNDGTKYGSTHGVTPYAQKPLNEMEDAIAKVCAIDPTTITNKMRAMIYQAFVVLAKTGATEDNVIGFGEWWKRTWIGRTRKPRLDELRNQWGAYRVSTSEKDDGVQWLSPPA